MAYECEVFISYRRDGAGGEPSTAALWLVEHFVPLLKRHLPDYLAAGSDCRIFLDDQIPAGHKWPIELRNKLGGARCLLPVFTAQYFASDWCMGELRSMQAREEVLGMGKEGNSKGLIFPVVLSDGEHFPEEIERYTQRCCMKGFGHTHPSFAMCPEYARFETRVMEVATQLGRMVAAAPSWRKDWPIELPEGSPNPADGMPIPRLRRPR